MYYQYKPRVQAFNQYRNYRYNEKFKWFELLIACVISWMGYQAPIWMLVFQKILRKLVKWYF